MFHPLFSSPLKPHASRVWVWLLVAALLCLQLMGQIHRVRHLPQGEPAVAAAQAVSTCNDGATCATPHTGWLDHLRAASGDPSDCRLYDQLGVADVLLVVPTLLSAHALPQTPHRVVAGTPACAPPRFFTARGPPDVR